MASNDTTRATGGVGSRKKLAAQVCIFAAIICLVLCIVSPLTDSGAFMITPLFGLVTIAVGIYARSWWTIPVGILEIVAPAITIYLTYYALAHGA
ncbi:hypothetical protein [Brachybacterium nesterenkovii]|uniref:hypothetical protein n=1 Tax=Brachybacterium nesterenkovii TaxID=47847 RepID=UPI00117883CE|nr:hypothetical protein [Brachybacterium nesterenkovii]